MCRYNWDHVLLCPPYLCVLLLGWFVALALPNYITIPYASRWASVAMTRCSLKGLGSLACSCKVSLLFSTQDHQIRPSTAGFPSDDGHFRDDLRHLSTIENLAMILYFEGFFILPIYHSFWVLTAPLGFATRNGTAGWFLGPGHHRHPIGANH